MCLSLRNTLIRGRSGDPNTRDPRGPRSNHGVGGPGYTIKAEFNDTPQKRGIVSMARTNDPHSATAQFFINLKDNTFLNHTGKNPQGWGYTVFGKVTEGMDVVDKIAKVKTAPGRISEAVPAEAVVIEKAEVV